MRFLNLTNKGYLDFTRNLCLQFQQPFLSDRRLLIECLDSSSLEVIQSWNFKNIEVYGSLVHKKVSAEFASYGTAAFADLTICKFEIILKHLAEGPLWFVDGDLAFFSDPLKYWDGESDFAFQCDLRSGDEEEKWTVKQCTGNFVINRTEKAASFLKELMLSPRQPEMHDQAWLQYYLRRQKVKDLRQYERCRMHMFSTRLFPNGELAFGPKQWWRGSVIAHANYMKGMELKKKALESCGKWFL